ncbi:sigma-70 family RNA polymerase sigma factor [Candidatus Uhrbacteria bacterium]|nr:sigma-70 family RNA polymerase sigma factor [Candidatus Uhrbacteria bacterium]
MSEPLDIPVKKVRCKELGDPAAFEKLFDRLAAKIFRYAFLRLSSKEDAEDVLSGTFLRVWEYLKRHEQEVLDYVDALVYRIARNLIIDQYRAKAPKISLEVLLTEGFELPAQARESPEKKTEYALVLQLFSKLDAEERDILLLRHVEGFSVIEIAALQGITENNASVRIHRALQKLKDLARGNVT